MTDFPWDKLADMVEADIEHPPAEVIALHQAPSTEHGSEVPRMDRTRQQWQEAAEYDVRTACFPSERVSSCLADWLTGDDRENLAYHAKRARAELFQIMKNPGDITVNDWQNIRMAARILAEAVATCETAGLDAQQAAIEKETARRQTDEAWERELAERERIRNYLKNGPTGTDI
jgi:hypothetical protein